MKIVAISDVHEQRHDLIIPECDLLISACDYSYRGDLRVVKKYHEWLNKQPARFIISVQGNHEVVVERQWDKAREIVRKINPYMHFEFNRSFTINDYKIHCMSYVPIINLKWAYEADPFKLYGHAQAIPCDTQILITHSPPQGILDFANGEYFGCQSLKLRLRDLKDLKLHVFGHIHESSGEVRYTKDSPTFINASICNEQYKPVNPVRVIEI